MSQSARRFWAVFVVSLIVGVGRPFIADAQSGTWSPAQTLYQAMPVQSTDPIPLWYPSIVADSANGLHVFWAVIHPIKNSAIFYTFYDGKQWFEPRDILIGNDRASSNQALKVVLDDSDYFHIIWSNGASLYYSTAYAAEAYLPQAWSQPTAIAEHTIGADLAVDPQHNIHVVYVSLNAPYELRYVSKWLSIGNWSIPTTISQPLGTDLTNNRAAIAVASSRIHVAWEQDQLPDGWPPAGVMYSYSDDGGQSWMFPKQLAASSQGAPSLFFANGQLHVAWFSTGLDFGRYASWSADNGNTWQPVQTLADDIHGLLLGTPQFALDSGNQLHLAMSGAQNDDESTWYSVWEGARWAPVQQVIPASPNNEQGLDIAISEGHLLHLVWLDLTHNEIRYSFKDTGAPTPSIEPGPLPTLTPTFTPPIVQVEQAGQSVAQLSLTPTPATITERSIRPEATQATILEVSLGITFAFVLVIVIIEITRRRTGRAG